MKTKDIHVYFLQMPTYEKRVETFEGKEYIVVPVVMMVEGVHRGSKGALFHSKEELGKIPDAWNGRPVVINHPTDTNGTYISANSPQVLEQNAVGYVFNTHMKAKKLVAEAWLDSLKLQAVSPLAYEAINTSTIIEVSIGAFTEATEETGTWEGEEYNAIAYNLKPDHLALLPAGEGACSVADGCGIRVNEKKGENNEMKKAIVINGENFNISPEDLEVLNKQGINISRLVVDESLTKLVDRLYSAINAMDTEEVSCYVVELFEDTVIYRKRLRKMDGEGTMWKQAYQVADDGSIIWVGAPMQVVQNITYRPVPVAQEDLKRTKTNKKEILVMEDNKCTPCVKKKVDALIANTSVALQEEDREWLESLEEAQLDKLVPKTPAPAVNTVEPKPITKEQAFATLGIKNPKEFEEQMQFGLNIYNAQRAKLIDSVVANTKEGVWSKEELGTMNFETLQKLAKSVTVDESVVDYSVFGRFTPPKVENTPTVAPMPLPGVTLKQS